MHSLLIADNNKLLCEELSGELDWGTMGFHRVVTAGSFPEAIHMGMEMKPDLALIEGDLDGGRGLELIWQFREISPQTLICALLRPAETARLRDYMRAGTRDYLLKPVERGELRDFAHWALTNVLIHVASPEMSDQEVDPVLEVSSDQFSRTTAKLISLVHSGYRMPLSLTELAGTLGMSSKYIGRVFRRDTGLRFSDYLMAYRMRMARTLLLTTREKISVIANMVGYSQPNNFYIHFRSYYGVSPCALREGEAVQEAPDEKSV